MSIQKNNLKNMVVKQGLSNGIKSNHHLMIIQKIIDLWFGSILLKPEINRIKKILIHNSIILKSKLNEIVSTPND